MTGRIPFQAGARETRPPETAQEPQWSHAEALAFEAARECITDTIAILSGELYATPAPSGDRADALRQAMRTLAARRDRLHVADVTGIAQVRAGFGAFVRTYRGNPSGPADLVTLASL